MRMVRQFAMSLLFVACLAYAREVTVNVTDVSGAGSPVVVSGTVRITESIDGQWRNATEDCKAVGRNISSKKIISLVIGVQTTDWRGPASSEFD